MLIAQLSDFHVSRSPLFGARVDVAAMARRAVDAVLGLPTPPDAVIMTGDLAEHGLSDEYEALLKELARLPMPLLAVPGNHDRREAFRQAWARRYDVPALGPLNVSTRVGEVRLIGLDTLVEGSSHGQLDEASLSFLSRSLEEDRHACTLLFMHHPPIACGIPAMDRIRLLDGAAALEEILRDHEQVERVLCGHVHRSIQMRFGKTICAIAPSVAHQVAPDFRDTGRIALTLEPPAFLLHWIAGRQVTSHLLHVDPTITF